MTEYEVGPGGLAAVGRAVKPGDTVILRAGVYRERLTADTPGVTWQAAEPGTAVIDGGWQGMALPGEGAPQVIISAAGVTLEGLVVRNSPGRGIAATADDATIRGCVVDRTYGSGVTVNGADRATITDCTITRASSRFKATRQQGGGGMVLVKTRGSMALGNTIAYCYGEGLDIDRDCTDGVISGNVIYDCGHVHLYIVRGRGNTVEDNLVFQTGNEEFKVGDGANWPACFAIGDETGQKMHLYERSAANVVRRNILIGGGVLLHVRSNGNADGYLTVLDAATAIQNNTLIAGPNTRGGLWVDEATGHAHGAALIADNAIWPGSLLPSAAARIRGEALRTRANVIATDTDMVNPAAVVRSEYPGVGHNIDTNNYRPRALSRLVGAGTGGSTVGALPVLSAPPTDPDKPDVTGALARLSTARQQLEAIAAAGNAAAEAFAIIHEQLAVMALAQADAADNVAAARTLLEG